MLPPLPLEDDEITIIYGQGLKVLHINKEKLEKQKEHAHKIKKKKNDEGEKLDVGWAILLLLIYICGHTCHDIHHHYHIRGF